MKVIVKLFAMVREVVGYDEISVTLPEHDFSIAALRERLVAEHSALEPFLPFCQVAVNQEIAADDQLLNATDEVAILPPFSGG